MMHVFRSLSATTLVLASFAGCSEQTVPMSSGGAAGQSASPSGGAAGPSNPPLATAGSVTSGGMVGMTMGGTGGSGGSGGSGAGMAGASSGAGSGGMVPYVPPVSSLMCPAAAMGGSEVGIANFDEGLDILGVDGRGGVWFGYSDGTGSQTDNPIPVVASDLGGKALHITGGGYTNWGSGFGCAIGFDFQKNAQCPYDASAFSGIRLKVKGSGTVRLRIVQVATTPATVSDRLGTCDPNKSQCEGHHEVPIVLTEDWTDHEFAWADFQQTFGKPVDFNAKTVLGLGFEFNSNTTYDAWIDDIEFTLPGAGGGGNEGGAGGDSN
jgi:hypothetical protein